MARGGTALAVVLLGGCMGAYEPESLLVDPGGEPHGHGRRVGCLDVRVELVRASAVEASWPVVGLDVGNRCRQPVYVDLRHVRVTARWDGPEAVALPAYDPRLEIGGAVLDGRGRAREVLAFVAPDGVWDRPASVCVDVSGITAAEASPPVCFEEGT